MTDRLRELRMELRKTLEGADPKASGSRSSATSVDDWRRILIVDDSPTVVEAVRRKLEPLGLVVDTVGHFVDIPRYMHRTPPDAVILDLNMPGLSGKKISEFIRRDQQRDTPIIIFSSQPIDELRAAAEHADAFAYVPKNHSLDDLTEAVCGALGGDFRP